jgi:hypothetical protein
MWLFIAILIHIIDCVKSIFRLTQKAAASVTSRLDCLVGEKYYASNSLRGSSDCRMIDCRVPMRISVWFGTGTVMVRLGNRRCITIWLPRCRISMKPCRDKTTHTSLPERISSLPNGNLNLRDKYFSVTSVLYFFRRCRFKE